MSNALQEARSKSLFLLQLKQDLSRCKSIEWQRGRCVLVIKEWDGNDAYEAIAYSIVRRYATVLRMHYLDETGAKSTKHTHYEFLMSWSELKKLILKLSKENDSDDKISTR